MLKRNSDQPKLSISNTNLYKDPQFTNAYRKAKNSLTVVKLKDLIEINKKQINFYNITPMISSTLVVDKIIDYIINGLEKDIKIVENKKLVKEAASNIKSL